MIYDSKPWLKSYDAHVPAEMAFPELSVKEMLVQSLEKHPDRIAFHFMGLAMTFGELLELSGRFAGGLRQKGFGKGDVVAVNLPNLPQYLIAILGSLRAGCAVSGLAPLLMPEEMVYQLNDSGASVLVTLEDIFQSKYMGVADQTPGVKLVLDTVAPDFLKEGMPSPAGTPLPDKEVMGFKEFLQGSEGMPNEVTFSPEDPCYLQYTGGTTGPSKGAMLTHGNMVANLSQFSCWMKIERATEVWLTGFPMFHQAGLFMANCAMSWGATQILIPDPRNIEHIIQEYERFRPTALSNVPSLYLMLLTQERFRRQDFSQVKYFISGAAPFPAEGVRALEEVVGKNKMVEVWGMTETSPLITINPLLGPKKIGSVGVPLSNTRFRIVDLADGETPVPLGEAGELICSGPQVMKGYLNKPEESRGAMREHDGAVWMHTGDVGRMDEHGYIFLVDRAKDMLIVGGFKVFSSEVEDKFYRHPAVEMCALIGIPNPDRPGNEIVKLVVQKSAAYRTRSDEETEAELNAFAREKLAPYKVPKIYEFIDTIPLTSIGKVDKKVLRK